MNINALMATIGQLHTDITTETEIIVTEIVIEIGIEIEEALTKGGELNNQPPNLLQHFNCSIYLDCVIIRYPPMGYPNNHYISHNNPPYYPPDGVPVTANSTSAPYRYPPGGSSDWSREREFEYRRDYDRRTTPPSGAS